jgi:DnaJ family protein A protein 2
MQDLQRAQGGFGEEDARGSRRQRHERGQTITFSGESDQAPGVVPGDVVIVIEEKPHERFKRNDNNLVTDVEIDLLMALGGGQFSIKHLDDRVLVVTIPPGDVVKQGMCQFGRLHMTPPDISDSTDEMKVIHGQGMPSKRHHEMGDLYIKISIKWPEHIDPNKIHLLEQVLPPRKPLPKTQKNVLVEEVDMSDVDPRQERVMQEDPMDEDEGEPRVQCANQ